MHVSNSFSFPLLGSYILFRVTQRVLGPSHLLISGPHVSIWGFGTLLKGTSKDILELPTMTRTPSTFCQH